MLRYFFLLLLIVLALRLGQYQLREKPKTGDKVVLNYTFFEDPRNWFGEQVFTAEGIKIYTYSDTKFSYGDSIVIRGTIEEERFTTDSGDEVAYLAIKESAIEKKEGYLPIKIVAAIRNRITKTFKELLPHTEAGLLLGIVFGVRDDIPKSLYEDLQRTGVLHVVAASGANVSMVGGFVGAFLIGFFSRKKAMILTSLVLIIYCFISGLDPSIVRATIMALFAYGAGLTGRQNASVLALFYTASLMLIFSPNLVNSVSFQLSFAATFGIVVIKPRIDSLLAKKLLIKDDLSTTLAAQIATLPIFLYTFSSYSLLSIFINLLVLWTIPIIMAFGIIGAVGALIFPPIAALPLFLSLPLLIYFKLIIQLTGNYAGVLTLASFPIPFVIGYYFFMLALVYNKKIKPYAA